jgi:hypothetical protein
MIISNMKRPPTSPSRLSPLSSRANPDFSREKSRDPSPRPSLKKLLTFYLHFCLLPFNFCLSSIKSIHKSIFINRKSFLKNHKSKLVLLALGLIIILSPLVYLSLKNAKQTEAAWFNTSWQYRKQLIFNNADQAENLSNFPVMIKLTSGNFNFNEAQSSGADLRFTDSDGTTQLSYEIESYNPTTQTATVWVNVPQIDASSSTDHVYLYYGNPSATDGQNANNTWNSNYKGVWHLNDNTSNTTVTDSSGNNHNFTASQNTNKYSSSGNITNSFTTMGTPQTLPSQTGSISEVYPSLKIDTNDYPVIAYSDYTNYDLVLIHCNDANCVGNDESVVTVDTVDSRYASLQLDSNGFPVIAYYDSTNTALRLAHCTDVNCSGTKNITTIESSGTVGLYPILLLDSNDYPIIAYYDSSNTAVKLSHCEDINCSGNKNIVFVDNTESDGTNYHGTSMILDGSSAPVLSYYNTTNTDLKLTHCGNANCSSGNTTVTVITSANAVGYYTSLKLDSSGYPMIAYADTTGDDLMYAHCTDVNCSSPPTPIAINTSYDEYPQMQLTQAGNPVIVWQYATAYPRLSFCADTNCSSDTEMYITTYNQNGAFYPVMELDSQDFPVVAAYSYGTNGYYDIQIYRLNPKIKQNYDADFNFGTGSFSTSIWFKSNDAANNYLLTRYDTDQGYKVWLDYGGHPCFGIDDDTSWGPDDSACTNPTNTQTDVDNGQAGDPNEQSMVLDTAGNPVIAYFDYSGYNLEIVHCNDVNCSGGNEDKASVESTNDVGRTPSLVLDGDGFPVIAYHDNTNQKLRLAHCADAYCSSGTVINEIPGSTANEGDYPTLRLDGSGFPVIAYYDTTNTAVKLVHCNDVNCAGGDESVVTVADSGVDRPYVSMNWMSLDLSGNPVLAFNNDDTDDLILVHCNDVNCAGSDEARTTVDATNITGRYATMVLDTSDYPVIAYYDADLSKLKLAHCTDVNCSGSKNINYVTNGELGWQGYYYVDMKLNASGNPVILHYSLPRWDHTLTICNDANCAGDDESFTFIRHNSAESYYHSLALDSNFYPVISYPNGSDLNLLHATSTTYTDTNAFDNGQWHQLVAVKSANSALYLYIDGVQVASDLAVNRSTLNSDSAQLRLADNIVGIGGTNYSIDNWSGQIDEVQIDNTARSAAWVAAQYKSESNTFITYGVTQTDPIAYWKFDEGTGSTAYDSTGNQYHGLLGIGNSAPTWQTADQCTSNKCLSFDGGDYINIGSTISDIKTVSFWIYPTTDTTSILELNGSNTITITSNTISANNFSTPTIYVNGISTTTLAINTWQHIEITTNTGISGTTINFGKVSANFFQGIIDEIKFFTYPRSAAQVKTDYNSRGSIGGTSVRLSNSNQQDTRLNDYLVAHYKFDEGYSNTVNNSSVNGSMLNGTFGTGSSAPTWTNDGKYEKALNFDGNDYLSVVDSPYFDIGSSGFTYSAWIKITGDYSAQSYNMFMGHYLPYFCIRNSGKLFISFTDGTQRSLLGKTVLNTNQWYHAVATYDSQGYLKTYLNGKLETTAGPYGTASNQNSNMYIGTWYSGITGLFPGLIDEVKIYNTALTQDEIRLDYNQGMTINLGALSTGTGNTAPSTAASQTYCIPGDTAACSPPVAEYNFDEISGTTAYDKSGNNNHGVLGTGNSAPTWGYGKIGGALKFDGANDYLAAGTSPNFDLGTGNFTIGWWMKFPISQSEAFAGVIADQSWESGATRTNYFGINQGNGTQSLKYYEESTGNGSYDTNVTLDSSIPNGWHYFNLIRDTTNDKLLFYRDGVNVYNAAYTADVNLVSHGLFIGQAASRYSGSTYDQVRIYNYARTPSQIAYDYNHGGPVAWYKFDECQGTTTFDSSGIGNTGNISIGASGTQTTAGTCGVGSTASAWSNGASGKYSSSLNFDGTDDYVDMGNISIFDIPASKQITVSAWFNASATGSDKRIVDSTNNGNGYALSLNSTTPTFIVGNGTAYQSLGTTGFSASTGIWYHIVGTFNDGVQKIYLNGIERNSNTIAGTFTTDPGVTFKVGTRSTNQYFTGQIDDVKIFNYALTSTQIKTLYNSAAIFFGPNTGVP